MRICPNFFLTILEDEKKSHLVSRFWPFTPSAVQAQNVGATPVYGTRTAIGDRDRETGEVIIEVRGHFVVEWGERRTDILVSDGGLADRWSRCAGGGGGHRFWSISGAGCVRWHANGRSTSHRRSGTGRGGRPPVDRVRGRVVLVSVGRAIVVGGRGVLVGG